ncbi:MAG TPA: HAMP domain-containing sensor histidine kinase, partial [Propionicimonas sp.]
LALAIRSVVFSQAKADLTRESLVAAAQVGPGFGTGDPVELPAPPADVQTGVYDSQLELQAGGGPMPADSTTRSALDGSISSGEELQQMIIAVPVSQEEHVVGVARAATPLSVLWWRTAAWWAALIGAAAVSFAAALLVARRQANRLTAPLKDLAAVSERLRSGDLAARAGPSGIPELDALATAQNASADTITTLLERERRYASQVSHQLRTPLARMTLALDTDRAQRELGPVAEGLSSEIAQLTHTVAGLLTFAREPGGTMFDSPTVPMRELMERTRLAWHGPLATRGRRIQIRVSADLAETRVPVVLAEQILGVLIDNAATHGSGTVTIDIRDLGEAIAIDVEDEGSLGRPETDLFSENRPVRPHGIGLPLARSLAEAHGGRLQLTTTRPTTFTWLLIRTPPPSD